MSGLSLLPNLFNKQVCLLGKPLMGAEKLKKELVISDKRGGPVHCSMTEE